MKWFRKRETPDEAFDRARREQIERVIAALSHLRDGIANITATKPTGH